MYLYWYDTDVTTNGLKLNVGRLFIHLSVFAAPFVVVVVINPNDEDGFYNSVATRLRDNPKIDISP